MPTIPDRPRRLRPPAMLLPLLCLVAAAPAAAGGWDDVPATDLTLAAPTVEPGADAEILLWEVRVEDYHSATGFHAERKHFRRIKAFTDAGAQQLTQIQIEVPKDYRIRHIEARTVRPDGSVRELDRKAVFRETSFKSGDVELRRVSFALPGVVAGAVVEYRFTESRDDALTNWSILPLQDDEYPVREVHYFLRPLDVPGWTMRHLHYNAKVEAAPVRGQSWYELSARDLPAFRPERAMPAETQVRSYLLVYYVEQDENGSFERQTDSYWRDVGRRVAKEFDDWSKPDDEVRRQAAEIVGGAGPTSDGVERLFAWCRGNLRLAWSAQPESIKAAGIRRAGSARDVLQQRAGTPNDANRLFSALLRAAGYEARKLELCPKSSFYMVPDVAEESFLTHYDIAVREGSDWRVYDLGARDLPAGMLVPAEEGQMALLCLPDAPRLVTTPVAPPAQSRLTRIADLELEPDGRLTGTLRVRFAGHYNRVARALLRDAATAGEGLDSLSAATGVRGEDDRWTDLRVGAEGDPWLPLEVSARVDLAPRGGAVGDRMIVEPSVLHSRAPALFSAGERRYPVAFDFAGVEVDSVRVRLPDGWEVEDMSTPGEYRSPAASYESSYYTTEAGRGFLFVRVLRRGEDGRLYFPREQYPMVRETFERVSELDRMSVVLRPAATHP